MSCIWCVIYIYLFFFPVEVFMLKMHTEEGLVFCCYRAQVTEKLLILKNTNTTALIYYAGVGKLEYMLMNPYFLR